MSGENETARIRCVRFFKIGRHLGNLENLRERLSRLHHQTIGWDVQLITGLCMIKADMEISSSVNLESTEEKLMDMYEGLVNKLMDQLLKDSK
jgi:hypothetical protein